MAKKLRLGLTLTKEDAKVFWQNERTTVTQEQKDNLRKAQKIYSEHPIKF
jgi:hypothetical protein